MRIKCLDPKAVCNPRIGGTLKGQIVETVEIASQRKTRGRYSKITVNIGKHYNKKEVLYLEKY